MKLLIKNGRVVHPVTDTVLLQDLLVEDGKIAILEHGLSSEADRTIDAAGLVEAWERGEFPTQCIVEGPIAMDVALNRESALHKGIESRVSGDADIFLMPIMEVGNVAIKGLLQKNPDMRLSAEDLMHHPWFADMKTRMNFIHHKKLRMKQFI